MAYQILWHSEKLIFNDFLWAIKILFSIASKECELFLQTFCL